jgi:ABC-type nitrate/sulfonate/bicarbonate transport system substrate-binding protein
MKRLLIALFLVLVVVPVETGSVSCSRSYPGQVESVVAGVPPLEQNALIYVAQSQQFFIQNGLIVTIKDCDTGVATINALTKGEVDIAEAAEFPLVNAAFQKQPVQIIAVNDRFENDYLVVLRDRGVNGVADLKGKRIGVVRGTILEFYLGRFLELHGVNLQDVVIVNSESPSRSADALVKGEVDALVAFQPYVHSMQTQLAGRVSVWPVQNNQLAYGILAANSNWLTQNAVKVQRFLKSLAEAEDYLVAHPAEAKSIVQKALNLDSSYIASVWPQHQFRLSLDPSLISAINDEAHWMINNKLTTEKTVPDFHDYVYLDGLKAVRPQAVTTSR